MILFGLFFLYICLLFCLALKGVQNSLLKLPKDSNLLSVGQKLTGVTMLEEGKVQALGFFGFCSDEFFHRKRLRLLCPWESTSSCKCLTSPK